MSSTRPGHDHFRERRLWRPRTLVADDGGLIVQRGWGRARRIWWSDVRAVEWLGPDRAVVRTARGDIELTPSFGEVGDIVASLEMRARAAQEAWRAGHVPPDIMAHWLDLGDGGALVCQPHRTRWRWWVVGLLIAAGILMRQPLPAVALAGLLLAVLQRWVTPAREAPIVLASADGLTVWQRHRVFRCHWSEVTALSVEQAGGDAHRGEDVQLAARGERITFAVRGRERSRLLSALRRYEAALGGRFDEAGLAPPPDTALSRLTGDEVLDDRRGLSRMAP